MNARGYLPQKPIVMITEDGDDAAIEAVKQTAEQALATGQNARQMVINRDPRLSNLEEIAADYPTRVAASEADRASIHASIASLAKDVHDEVENRADADAVFQVAISGIRADLARIQLTPGVDGKSAYDIARSHGYGGTETQWLATLKGDPGKDGTTAPAAVAVGTGRIAVALLLGGAVDVVVNFSRSMPTTTYNIGIAPTAGFTFGTPKNKTQTSVTIPVTAGIALAVGASFTVIAWA